MKTSLAMTLPDDCSTRDVAQVLGLAVRSVQLMVDRGELEAWKTPGGHRRIARASVERWLAQRQAGAVVVPGGSPLPDAAVVPGAAPPRKKTWASVLPTAATARHRHTHSASVCC